MSAGDPRAQLVALATAGGTSLSALSRMLGRNAAYLQQYVRRGSPRVLPEADRRRLAAFFGVEEARLGGPAAPSPSLRVPRLDVAASAGPGAFADTEVTLGAEMIDTGLARRLGLKPDAAAIIRVRGSSMEPALADGDHILVDTDDRAPTRSGGIFVIRIEDAVMVKRVRLAGNGLEVSSDNPHAPKIPEGRVDVIGRVVWQMRRWR